VGSLSGGFACSQQHSAPSASGLTLLVRHPAQGCETSENLDNEEALNQASDTLTGGRGNRVEGDEEGGEQHSGGAASSISFRRRRHPEPETLPPHVSAALGKPSADMSAPLSTRSPRGADATAMPDDAGRLLSVGGVVATLRY
jgi:hypothetical protein